MIEASEQNPEYLARFDAIGRLYGVHSLKYFARSHVCVIGLGGVGSWVVESLARTGIGAITLVDGDSVCVSNTNRQLHALASNVGPAENIGPRKENFRDQPVLQGSRARPFSHSDQRRRDYRGGIRFYRRCDR